MNGRGDVIVTVLALLSMVLCVGGSAGFLLGAADGTLPVALGCFCMAWAIYLEVYSHRE